VGSQETRTRRGALSGRRRDEVLRVIDEDPRMFGLRPKTLVLGLALLSLSGACFLLAVYALKVDLVVAAPLLVLSWGVWFVILKVIDYQDDPNFLLSVVRFYGSRRRRTVFAGGCPPRRRRHGFEDFVVASRVCDLGGGEA
jgi:hypothetical protein